MKKERLEFYAKHADAFKTMNDVDIAKMLGVEPSVICKWRKRLGIEHPRKAGARKARQWFGKIPDRIISKMTGLTKYAVTTKRQRAGMDNTAFEDWHDKSWVDELVGLDTDERIAALCEVGVDLVRSRREALGIEPHRRRFLISVRRIGSLGPLPPPKEYELMGTTNNGLYLFRIVDSGARETFTKWQLRDAKVKEITKGLVSGI